jgi:pimeloyl-ACP methyl ester carboxylesterase
MSDIVFIHGARQGSWVWKETIAALKNKSLAQTKLLALDVPGCGNKCRQPKPDYHVADIAQTLSDEIIKAGIKQGVLVSHSQGATLVPHIIAQTPGCFSKVLFIAAVAPLEGQTVAQAMGSNVHGDNDNCVGWPLPPKTTELNALLTAMFFENTMRDETLQLLLARGQIDAWPSHTVFTDNHWGWEQLNALDVSYLIAKNDNTVPPDWQEKFADRISQNTRKYYLEAGHQVMQTQADSVAEILHGMMSETA